MTSYPEFLASSMGGGGTSGASLAASGGLGSLAAAAGMFASAGMAGLSKQQQEHFQQFASHDAKASYTASLRVKAREHLEKYGPNSAV
jgi:hypothetical protein